MPLADIARDLRYAIRGLLASPGFTLGIIGSLTLGIVVNTAAFSFINAAVFRPFPGVRDQHELVRLGVERREGRGSSISSTFDEYQVLAASVPALRDVAAHLRTDLAVAINGQSSALRGAIVTRNYFEERSVRQVKVRARML